MAPHESGAFAAMVALEGRLTARSNATRLIWLAFAIVAFLTVRGHLNSPQGTWTTAMIADSTRETLPVFQLLSMLWAAIVVSQDSVSEFVQLRESYAYGVWRRAGTHLVALLAGTLVLSATLAAISAMPILTQNAAPFRMDVLLRVFPLYIWLRLVYASFMGYALGAWLRSGLALYPVLLGTWFLTSAAPFAYELGKRGVEWAGILGMVGDIGIRVVEAPLSAGDRLLLWSHCVVYSGLGVVLIAVSRIRTCMDRYRRPTRTGIIAVMLSSAMMIGGAWVYVSEIHRRVDNHQREMKAVASTGKEVDALSAPIIKEAALAGVDNPMDSYELRVGLDGQRHSLVCDGTMRIINASNRPQDTVYLTLRENLTVTKAELTDGTGLHVVRSGHHLAVRLPKSLAPGAFMDFSMTWSGRVEHWRRSYVEQLFSSSYHIYPDSVFLPEYYGWYPLPGIWRLGTGVFDGNGRPRDVSDQLVPLVPGPRSTGIHGPVPYFKLEVKGFPKSRIDTGLGDDGRGRTAGTYIMVGGRTTFTKHGIHVSCYRDHKIAMTKVADMMANRWEYFAKLTNPDKAFRMLGLVEEPSSSLISIKGMPGRYCNIYLAEGYIADSMDLTSETDLSTGSRSIGRELTRIILDLMMDMHTMTAGSHTTTGNDPSMMVESALGTFLSALYDDSVKPGSYQKFISAWNAGQDGGTNMSMPKGINTPPTPARNGIIQVLHYIKASKGLDGVGEFLRYALSYDPNGFLPSKAGLDQWFLEAITAWNTALTLPDVVIRKMIVR